MSRTIARGITALAEPPNAERQRQIERVSRSGATAQPTEAAV